MSHGHLPAGPPAAMTSRAARFFAPELRPRLFAHRGASGHCPENTLPAFCLAIELGAPYLELDVRMSLDGHVVIHHDETVDRTTQGTGPVAGKSLAEIRALDAGYGFRRQGKEGYPFRGRGVRIPTLDEVLEAFPEACVNVEVKQQWPPMESTLEGLLVRHRALDRALLTAADHRVMERIRVRLGHRVATGTSSREGTDLAQWFLRGRPGQFRLEGQAVQIPDHLAGRDYITPPLVEAVHGLGAEVHVWTVNDPARMIRLLEMGVDGIMTDFPDRFPRGERRGS